MNTPPSKDWIDIFERKWSNKSALRDEANKELSAAMFYEGWLAAQHVFTPPPVPKDVRELASHIVVECTSDSFDPYLKSVCLKQVESHINAFITAHDAKRDAAQKQRDEKIVRVLEDALIPLQVAKQQNCGLGEYFYDAVESITTLLAELKEGK